MTTAQSPRVRRSLTDLQNAYEGGDKKPLETVMRAWRGVKALSPDDLNSFFVIGGYHGEPFRGAGWGNASYWGGYCNHGNVLFPTWHRAYLMRLENAMRSIPDCGDVALPFWDETSEESLEYGIPWALTNEHFVLDGKTIENPLKCFELPRTITDFIQFAPDANYSKPEGYKTVRYPLSGLVGTPADQEATNKHNEKFPFPLINTALLNQNIVNWLTTQVDVNGVTFGNAILADYTNCLDAPNYTVFSNVTSAAQWADDTGQTVIPLEQPHDSMHLAVGGFDLPGVGPAKGDASPIPGANGDMGENDTAALDPIFYFHHCFVDRVFWLWQKRHGMTRQLEIKDQYPGTNSVDSQGPTPGVAANSWLTLDSPLDPFRTTDGDKRPVTSRDVIDIENQLGYTYGPGSLEGPSPLAAAAASKAKTIQVRGVNRASIRGSFLISAFANIDGQRRHIGSRAVLSRWHVEGCANCQTHREARAFIPLRGARAEALGEKDIEIEIRTRDGVLGAPKGMAAPAVAGRPPFFVTLK